MRKSNAITLILLIILAAGAYFALTSGQFTDELTDSDESATSTSTTSDSVVEDDLETMEETTSTYSVNVRYQTEGVGVEHVEEYIQNRVSEFRDQTPDTAEGEFFRPYELQIDSETYSYIETTSYLITEYLYSGGASGVTNVETFVFSSDEERLSLTDVVPEENREELVSAVEARLREINNLSEDETLSYDISFETLENFYLSNETLAITFSQYEVAPGAAGMVMVELPADSFVELE